MDTQRRFVVLDGSNIVSQTKDANRTDGRILLSAIEFYEALGYTVIPVMYSGTIGYMKKNNHTGAETLAKMAKSKSIITFTEGDDEGVIQIALRRNGWIVTYDTFSHAKKDKAGNKIPTEREKYTHWDWDDIDERTRGTEKLSDGRVVSKKHWKVDGIDFHDPLMPKAPKELLSDEYTQVRRDLQVANRRFDRISVFLGEAETGELNKAMKKEMRKIRRSMTKLSRMIPVNQLPKDATIDNLLASECKQLIRLINQIDENANLALSGRVNELKARIKEYTAKAALDRAQLVSKEKKREQRKKQKKAERDSARELSYKTDWDIVINLDEDEFIKILIEVIEEAIMHKLEAPARISLNNEERLVYFESSLKKEDREYLAKNHKVWRQRLSQVLGLENTIRVILP